MTTDVDWNKCPIGTKVEAKIDNISKDIGILFEKVDEVRENVNGRLRWIEKTLWFIIGAVTILFGGEFLPTIIKHLVK